MSSPAQVAVTGAFSYSGAAIASELLDRGCAVRTLTNHPERAPERTPIKITPLEFADRDGLRSALDGVQVLYNTYWIRFPHHQLTFEQAVENSGRLFRAAVDAGVQRIVHLSITHPDPESPYPYFRGKAAVERLLIDSGASYAIARPAILFGGDGVLINNIAWLVRRFPLIMIGDGGDYRIRGIHVDDLATLCAELGERTDDVVLDAVGPESVSFRDLIRSIQTAVGSRAKLISVPGSMMVAATSLLGLVLRDHLLTRDEYRAMADGLADSSAPATGTIELTGWIASAADSLGRRYANELDRHFDLPNPHPAS